MDLSNDSFAKRLIEAFHTMNPQLLDHSGYTIAEGSYPATLKIKDKVFDHYQTSGSKAQSRLQVYIKGLSLPSSREITLHGYVLTFSET